MALYLRGNIWWMEYKTSTFRKQLSTHLPKSEKKKAKAVYEAFLLGCKTKPKKSAIEGILSAIYDTTEKTCGIPMSAVWQVYEEWCKGKGRVNTRQTYNSRKALFARFASYAEQRKAYDISDISVQIARDFIVSLKRSNKTQRTYCGYLSTIWEAVSQLHPNIHNPWKAACPDNDGSSVRHEAFSSEQIQAVLAEAKKVGYDWYRASLIALYTGLRFGDVATLQWSQVDLAARVIKVTPSKTKRSSGVEVWIPIADTLYDELKEGGEGFVLPILGVQYPNPPDIPFSTVLKAVGLTGREWGFHSWRHTANTRMAEAGIPSNIREMICGWTGSKMAKHYDHARHLDELTQAVKSI